MGIYTAEQFEESYEQMTASVQCDCTFLADFVGGAPADEEGIRAFVHYQLHLSHEEAEDAVKRIITQEVGEKPKSGDTDEIKEVESYAVNVLRKSNGAPWIGDWMIKANFKQAASRTGLFMEKRGTKGNFAEGGRVRAYGMSLLDPKIPQMIYIIGQDGKPAKSHFQRFHGKVSTPKGAQSIVHDSEVIPAGSRFSFTFHFLPGSVTEEDMVKVLALSTNCGLGSVRSMERGRFRIDHAVIDTKGLTANSKRVKKGSTAAALAGVAS